VKLDGTGTGSYTTQPAFYAGSDLPGSATVVDAKGRTLAPGLHAFADMLPVSGAVTIEGGTPDGECILYFDYSA
jgi:hypothetical protein